MNDKDKKLFEDFPKLYRGKGDNPRENRIVGGLEINEGWYELVYNLSEEIKDYCDENDHFIPKVFQVKEKFGGLRFYFGFGEKDIDDEIRDIVSKAESKSFEICEKCGSKGTLCEKNEGHWVKTLCPGHAEEMDYSPLDEELKKQLTGENIKELTSNE